MIAVLSLGAGVQSSAMILMAARGELEPMPDCAIFAETGDESEATYRHLAWLKGEGPPWDGREYRAALLPFPIHIARAWEGYGKPSITGPLGDMILAATRGEGKAGSHSRPPFYVSNGDGTGGIIRRQCTGDYKIEVIQAKERELLGLRRRQRWPKEVLIEQWIGISLDEVSRMTPIFLRRGPGETIPHPTIRARWPLIDARISRTGCKTWLTANGYPIPPKSACVYCPFHSDAEWRRIKDEDPKGWERAVTIDRAARAGLVEKSLRGNLFLHRSLKPLEEVDLSTAEERGQINLFQNDCTGMCGV